MKTVNLKVKGQGVVLQFSYLTEDTEPEMIECYDSWNALQEDGFIDEDWIELPFIHKLESITYEVDGKEKEITKKGKYINSKNYINRIVGVPHVVHLAHMVTGQCYYEFDYEIELEDDEEFDPMKLQLIKSDYEVNYMPYGIVVTEIMYDGKEVDVDEDYLYFNTWDTRHIYYYDEDTYNIPQMVI